MASLRRVAAHEVRVGENALHQAVVEIYDDRVVNYYEFRDELPMTEWLGGTIVLKTNDDGILQAFKDSRLLESE